MTHPTDASRRRTLAKLSALSLASLSPWALRSAAAQTPLTIGVVYVGPRDDFGHNQAQALAAAEIKNCPASRSSRKRTCPKPQLSRKR